MSEMTTIETTLGTKNPDRKSVRSRIGIRTSNASPSARVVVRGMVPATNTKVFRSAPQKRGSPSARA